MSNLPFRQAWLRRKVRASEARLIDAPQLTQTLNNPIPGIVEDSLEILDSSHPYYPHLSVAIKAAVLCFRGEFGRFLSTPTSSLTGTAQYTKSNDTDITTSVDLSNESLITAMITQAFPLHHIIGEEETSSSSSSSSSSAPDLQRPTWIIDPIDGTTNFA